jgi:hypothetical protein
MSDRRAGDLFGKPPANFVCLGEHPGATIGFMKLALVPPAPARGIRLSTPSASEGLIGQLRQGLTLYMILRIRSPRRGSGCLDGSITNGDLWVIWLANTTARRNFRTDTKRVNKDKETPTCFISFTPGFRQVKQKSKSDGEPR